MDCIREIARAYYARASEQERNSVKDFFKTLDADGDGKVSLVEFKASAGSWLCDNNLFKELDENSDGTLDFNEALALYYMEKKVRFPECDHCRDLLIGPYFSCLLCLKGKDTYDLCCSCFHVGKYEHGHPSSEFLDHHALLALFRDRTTDAEKNQGKGDMDGIREIARAYSARANEQERNKVKELFKSLDADSDGKVSLVEFKASAGSWLCDENLFKQLDENGGGTLDFDEALALQYRVQQVIIPRCDGCRVVLVGQYFSCWPCLEEGKNTFDLCCDCFHGGKFQHDHSPSKMFDHHVLLMLLRDRIAHAQKNQGKQEMEELREIAKAHYQAASPEVQVLAHDFFKALDTDGDGCVDLPEFLEFMRQEGYAQMRNPYFFKELDKDGNNKLDFWEVMTLYYLIKSGRPFCDHCGNLIPGIYFSCVECFGSSKSSFNLCRTCYQSGKCNHNHNGRNQFLDNYTLLEAQKNSALAQATGVNQHKASNSNPSININVVNHPSPTPNSSNAIVPASNLNKWKVALRAFEVGLNISSISSSLCTIL